jgi:hypothetical protein
MEPFVHLFYVYIRVAFIKKISIYQSLLIMKYVFNDL